MTMQQWTRVVWTEAGQITAILGWPEAEDDRTAPQAFFQGLRADGRAREAVLFLGLALPRFEAVVWAAAAVRAAARSGATPEDEQALRAVLLWLQDPCEPRRRAAFEAANRAKEASPEQMCALAAFFSGGSIAPESLAPVPAPKDVTGKFAAGAVLTAAAASGRMDQVLEEALDRGEALAQGLQ